MITTTAKATLRGVVFTDVDGSAQIDPALALDLLDSAALLVRLKKLLWNAAQAPGLSITLDGKVVIGLVSISAGTDRQLGINVSLATGQRFIIRLDRDNGGDLLQRARGPCYKGRRWGARPARPSVVMSARNPKRSKLVRARACLRRASWINSSPTWR